MHAPRIPALSEAKDASHIDSKLRACNVRYRLRISV